MLSGMFELKSEKSDRRKRRRKGDGTTSLGGTLRSITLFA